MEYIKDLESGSSPKVRKAAEAIYKNKLQGYCPYLIQALTKEIEKEKAWRTQCQLIKAIAGSGCTEALQILNQLLDEKFESTILYKELGLAIFILQSTERESLEFLLMSIRKGNVHQICGACAVVLKKKVVPGSEDIRRILRGIQPYTMNEGAVITPRCYIAAVAYLWPQEETRDFLESCKTSTWNGLVEIADNSLQGKESKTQLI
ncbi:hypothetical protein O5O45_11890 [Hahella aquimaris]|uniref:hypothetical protein n=1 Tax=Hahella sp. HNIBRBA332 TaxID=3015983 RepID=UPI00273B2FA7|nr:hypothetical protein [Hahella sp. HNIBRBA332]WLQ16620.1 hypothetical protein O5O45_11890 [Hahella sp. HNIBRBA332]